MSNDIQERYDWPPRPPEHLPQTANIPLNYAQIIQSLAFLTDKQRAGFFALLGASYCLHCGSATPDRCDHDQPKPWPDVPTP